MQEVIGIGGMGSVYSARDLHFPKVVKLVAVKEMINQAPDPLVRATIVQNFEREANILVTLNHPAIPKYLISLPIKTGHTWSKNTLAAVTSKQS